jgi:hypothetical protein
LQVSTITIYYHYHCVLVIISVVVITQGYCYSNWQAYF